MSSSIADGPLKAGAADAIRRPCFAAGGHSGGSTPASRRACCIALPAAKKSSVRWGWSIDDFELCYDGLRHISNATTWLQNQPRAARRDGDYLPGAAFIVSLGEDWCTRQIDALMNRLRAIRFPATADDERRVLLLVAYEASYGSASEPLAKIIQMALDQSVRAPA
jgi:hypothetical protein